MSPERRRRRRAVGWATVVASTSIACAWAVWGILENFHEGWYSRSLDRNLAMMLGQYLTPALGFMGAAVVGVAWPAAGLIAHLAGAAGAMWFFRGSSPTVLIPLLAAPLTLLGIGYAWGRPEQPRSAIALIVLLPLLTMVGVGVEPARRVAARLDDGDLGARRVAGNGVSLEWAPSGPGWPSHGVTWEEATRRCRRLDMDGSALADSALDLWRLPTVEEAVRSMQRGGKSCGGTWDPTRHEARYATWPDKESPLWNVHSKVIYWWTSTEVDRDHAYVVVYNGQVWARPKRAHWGYLAFRAVREAAPTQTAGAAP